ncbi:sugar kinase [Allomuricauda sp. NBRC 101325]|uniref:sugar kinase n=1 Tax=Allomuricauda sp. NBRC 101325 TaxID=1113758 RepID=UPI0024A3713D|nr:sugar kinase [Muricauda sp. NBRC 101325]GLU44839.1 2-dehydro-3-deoxygluconokinase [Muricauda sp. NBRC 101325]
MKKVVTFGEVMLRLSPPGFLRFSQTNTFDAVYGGAESNVAISLANFGIPVDFVTRLPKNEIGEAALQEIRKYGIGTEHIQYGGNRLGIYFLENGAIARGSNVVYDRSGSAMADIKLGMIDWKKVFEKAGWFHWTGITPAISQGAADACLEGVKIAKKMGLTVSCDLNYRSKLWAYGGDIQSIMSELITHCDIVLCHEKDVEVYFNIKSQAPKNSKDVKPDRVKDFISVSDQLMERFPNINKVITSLRGSISASHNTWQGISYDGFKKHVSEEFQITPIVDRVGGGDAFMGGYIYGLLTWPEDEQKALDFAVAASCLKHTIKGDANLVSVAEVEKLMGGDTSGKVSR